MDATGCKSKENLPTSSPQSDLVGATRARWTNGFIAFDLHRPSSPPKPLDAAKVWTPPASWKVDPSFVSPAQFIAQVDPAPCVERSRMLVEGIEKRLVENRWRIAEQLRVQAGSGGPILTPDSIDKMQAAYIAPASYVEDSSISIEARKGDKGINGLRQKKVILLEKKPVPSDEKNVGQGRSSDLAIFTPEEQEIMEKFPINRLFTIVEQVGDEEEFSEVLIRDYKQKEGGLHLVVDLTIDGITYYSITIPPSRIEKNVSDVEEYQVDAS